MPPITVNPASIIPPVHPWPDTGNVLVWLRPTWDSDWVPAHYLEPLAATEAALPDQSTAQFLFRYGDLDREDLLASAFEDPYHVTDWYVCIQVIPSLGVPYPIWCGILPSEQLHVWGTKVVGADERYPGGQQILTAYGFEYLLARRIVQGAWVDQVGDGETATRIKWQPTFNERFRQGMQPKGNRAIYKFRIDDVERFYCFSGSPSAAEPQLWSILDILQYVLWHSDEDNDGSEPSFGEVAGHDELLTFVDSQKLVVQQRGRNVLDIVNELLDRRRGVGTHIFWGVTDNGELPSGEDLILMLFSLTDEPIAIGDILLPANPHSEEITLDENLDIETAVASFDTLKTYDMVLVEGERVVTCFSMCNWPYDEQAHLVGCERAWTGSESSAYILGDAATRQRDDLMRVFRAFRLPDDFNWLTGPVVGVVLNPSFDLDGNIQLDIADNYWNHGLRFLPWLPLEHPGDVTPGDEEGTREPRYQRPFTLVEQMDSEGAESTVWHLLDAPGKDESDAQLPSASMVVGDREALVQFHPQGDPSLLALHIMGADGGGVYDYRYMIMTVAMETDTRPSVERLLVAHHGSPVWTRRLHISVRDCQVWVIAPGTAIGLSSYATPNWYTGSQILRDDTDRLRQVAAVAEAWYGKQRATVEVVWKGIQDIHMMGTFLETLIAGAGGDRQVATPVTARSWDFRNQTTRIATGHIDFDVGEALT